MANNFNNEKSCKNCKYFLQYYKKTATKYKPLYTGACTNNDLKWNERRNVPFENGCEKWELKEENKAENQENMLNVLRNMEKHLKEMILILKED